MEVRRDVLLGIITLLAFYIALSFAAVGLQERLEPTVSTIEDQNVVSIVSALELLARIESEDSETIEMLTHKLENNDTEEGEREVANRIAQILSTPVYKDTEEYSQLTDDLEEIVNINRRAMVAYSEQAFRLAQGGGWLLITLAFFGLWASWFVIRRLRQRIVLPLERLAETMRRGRSGTTRVRAYAQGAAYEIREAAYALNALLDDRAMNYERRRDRVSRPERNVVVALMEKVPHPAWILDENGEIRAANQLGMESQQGAVGRRIKECLRRIVFEQANDAHTQCPRDAFETVDLGDEDHLLCMLLDPCALDSDAQG